MYFIIFFFVWSDFKPQTNTDIFRFICQCEKHNKYPKKEQIKKLNKKNK